MSFTYYPPYSRVYIVYSGVPHKMRKCKEMLK